MYTVTKQAMIALTRTVLPYIYAWLIGLLPFVQAFLDDIGAADDVEAFVTGPFVLIVGSLVYALIYWLSGQWHWIGYLLVFPTKPEYTPPPIGTPPEGPM